MWYRFTSSPQHPRALLDQAIEESRAALAAHRVVIAVEEPAGRIRTGDRDKPQRPAWFDPHLLGRVLRHLLENAARYTPAGGRILLGSRCSGDRLEFRVEDDGPGIDAADLPFIFEKFYRGKKAPPRAREPGWAWPSRAPFWPRTAAGSRPRALPAREPASASGCRWWKKSRGAKGEPRQIHRIYLVDCSAYFGSSLQSQMISRRLSELSAAHSSRRATRHAATTGTGADGLPSRASRTPA
jgi:hypothetical protein